MAGKFGGSADGGTAGFWEFRGVVGVLADAYEADRKVGDNENSEEGDVLFSRVTE